MTTKLITVQPNATVAHAYQIIKQNQIRHLPVVDSDQTVLGILSDRDLESASFDTLVSSVMSYPIKIVSVEDGLEAVIDQMLENKISSSLLEEDGELVGIVTSEDLLRVLKDHLNQPSKGSVRTALYDYVIRYPLGAAAQVLSNAGI